jgi:hypothetical protein
MTLRFEEPDLYDSKESVPGESDASVVRLPQNWLPLRVSGDFHRKFGGWLAIGGENVILSP